MNRTIIACASLLLLGACERSAKDDLTKAQEAQHQANEQAAKSQREADEKSAKAQKEADEKIQRANEEARKDQAKSQGNANEDIRTANQDLTKKRNDLQTKTQKSANDLDNKIDDMKAKVQTKPPKVKNDFDTAMQDVTAKRQTLDTDMKAIPDQPAQSLDSYKAKVDKDIDELKKSIDKAQKKWRRACVHRCGPAPHAFERTELVKLPLPIVPFAALAWVVWQWATPSSNVELFAAGNAIFQIAAAIELAFARIASRHARLAPVVCVNSAPSGAAESKSTRTRLGADPRRRPRSPAPAEHLRDVKSRAEFGPPSRVHCPSWVDAWA